MKWHVLRCSKQGFGGMGASAQADILFELGMMYATGRDCEVDIVAAHKWFNIAAIKGSSRAAELRSELSATMTKAAIAQALREAREWMTMHQPLPFRHGQAGLMAAVHGQAPTTRTRRPAADKAGQPRRRRQWGSPGVGPPGPIGKSKPRTVGQPPPRLFPFLRPWRNIPSLRKRRLPRWAFASMTLPRISPPKPRKAKSISMSGSATAMRPVLSSEGFHAGLHDRTRLHGRTESGIRQTQRQDDRDFGRSGRKSRQVEGATSKKLSGNKVEYPIIGDRELNVAKLYDMLPAEAGETSEGRTPADNATVRSVFVIGPDKKIKMTLTYPMTTGRNFDEILRAIDSHPAHRQIQVATPAQWKQGEDVIITAAVSDEDANQRFGGFERVLPYLRKTKQPRRLIGKARQAGAFGRLPGSCSNKKEPFPSPSEWSS